MAVSGNCEEDGCDPLAGLWAEERLGVTFRSAVQTIERLVADGILAEMTGRARNRVVVAREIPSLLEAEARAEEARLRLRQLKEEMRLLRESMPPRP